MLAGKSVVLRPVKRSDVSYFLKWFNDDEVTRYLKLHLPVTEMAQEKLIEELATTRAGTEAWFIIEAIEDGDHRVIGATDLNRINHKDHSAAFSIVIGEKEYWGKGHGTEACRLIINYGFEQLNLHRISSSVVSYNERSIRMHKRVGFKEEGRQREAWFKNGAYHDNVVFGILRGEWKEG